MTTQTQKLYKRDTTKAIRVWYIEISEDETHYRMVSGQEGGAEVRSEWTEGKVKNEGRANATTPVEQVRLEVASAITKKKKQGYVEDVSQVDTGSLIKPMLAQDYAKRIKELPWNSGANNSVFAQPKLDGIRCLATPNGLFSRTGEEIVSCPHIAEIMIPIAQKYNCVFDGELYNHQLKEDFNQIASLVRKTKNIEESLEQIVALIQYHIYDVIIPEMDFRTRQNQLLNVGFTDINAAQIGGASFIFPVPTYEVTNQNLLDSLYGHFLEDGYEGQMVRANSAYDHKRSPSLLKRKEFQSDEFEILDVLEGEGNRAGMAGKLLLKLGSGTFKSNLKGNRDYFRALLERKENFIGKKATIKFFQYTPDGVPRFPVCVDIGRTDA